MQAVEILSENSGENSPSLEAIIDSAGFSIEERFEITLALIQAILDYHEKKITHDDLTAGNIVYDRKNKKISLPRPKKNLSAEDERYIISESKALAIIIVKLLEITFNIKNPKE